MTLVAVSCAPLLLRTDQALAIDPQRPAELRRCTVLAPLNDECDLLRLVGSVFVPAVTGHRVAEREVPDLAERRLADGSAALTSRPRWAFRDGASRFGPDHDPG